MPNDDWRFQNFRDTNRAYNRTLAVDTATSRAQFNATPTPTVNAASRIPNPSGTDWSATFGRNAPQSPSGTNWSKEFAPVWAKNNEPVHVGNNGNQSQSFNLSLSPSTDRSQLSFGIEPVHNDPTDFYKDRVANMDLTKRDHDLYGAGSQYGFGY